MSKKKKEKILYTVLLIVFGGIFVFSAGKLIKNLSDRNGEVRSQEELTDRFLTVTEAVTTTETQSTASASADPIATGATLPEQSAAETGESSDTFSETPETSETVVTGQGTPSVWPQFDINWTALKQANSDVKGWIWIYGTSVNYPVLQGDDNAEYLYSTIDKTYARSGSIFLDYRVNGDFTSKNTLIYGHNYLGLKFNALMDYRKQSFYDGHKYICIFTPDKGLQKYIIYSAYVTDIYSSAFCCSFADDAAYADFLNDTVSSSGISTGIVPTVEDNVITLSTCTNNGAEQRFVVHAILWNGEE